MGSRKNAINGTKGVFQLVHDHSGERRQSSPCTSMVGRSQTDGLKPVLIIAGIAVAVVIVLIGVIDLIW